MDDEYIELEDGSFINLTLARFINSIFEEGEKQDETDDIR